MSVRKLRASWWIDFRFNGVRYRKRSPDNTRTGAQVYEATLHQRLARGESISTAATPTLKEFSHDWLRGYVEVNNKPSEIRRKRSVLAQHLVPFFGSRRLDSIKARDVEHFKAVKLAAGLKPKTVNNMLIVLSKCLRSAQEWEYIAEVPKVRMLRASSERPDFLDAEAVASLIAAADEPWRAMITTAVATGMRLGELLGLQWEDIDFTRRVILVRRALVLGELTTPKSGRSRAIPLMPAVTNALSALPRRGPFVFERSDGIEHTAKSAWYWLHRYCRRAGVRPVGWHVLRHSFASHLVTGGAPIRAVQLLLGHSTVTMTERYAHLAPAFLHDTVATLAEQLPTLALGQPVGNAATHSAPAIGREAKRSAQPTQNLDR